MAGTYASLAVLLAALGRPRWVLPGVAPGRHRRTGEVQQVGSQQVPDHARLIENIKPAFAPAEVLDNFERYAKLFHEIFGGR